MAELVRVLAQSLRFSVRRRSLGLWLFVVLGLVAALVAAAVSIAAPVLIYPLV